MIDRQARSGASQACSESPVAHTVLDLFSGVGGMTLGFVQAGFRVVAGVDVDPVHVAASARNLPHCKHLTADLSDCSPRALLGLLDIAPGSIDVVIGGPPCQGFSTMGRRDPSDPRNSLIIAFARLVIASRPRYFVMENVSGLLEPPFVHLRQRFSALCDDAGYLIVEPVQILDASKYGVPQRRRRAFVLGYQRGHVAPAYPEPCDEGTGSRAAPRVSDAIGDLPHGATGVRHLDGDMYTGVLGRPSVYAAALRSDPGACERRHGASVRVGGLSGCRRSQHSREVEERFAATRPGTREPVSRYPRLAWDGFSPTLRAGTAQSHGSHTAARPIHPLDPRCISVREAARLQSFPDWFGFDKTVWHAFRQIGSAVPPILAASVASEIARALS